MMPYKQLSISERILIKKKLVNGKSFNKIAFELERSVSTIDPTP